MTKPASVVGVRVPVKFTSDRSVKLFVGYLTDRESYLEVNLSGEYIALFFNGLWLRIKAQDDEFSLFGTFTVDK